MSNCASQSRTAGAHQVITTLASNPQGSRVLQAAGATDPLRLERAGWILAIRGPYAWLLTSRRASLGSGQIISRGRPGRTRRSFPLTGLHKASLICLDGINRSEGCECWLSLRVRISLIASRAGTKRFEENCSCYKPPCHEEPCPAHHCPRRRSCLHTLALLSLGMGKPCDRRVDL